MNPSTSSDDSPRTVRHRREITDCLDWVRSRWRNRCLLEGALAVVLTGAAIVVGAFAVDNLVHLGPTARACVLVVAIVALLAAVVWWLALRPLTGLGDEECAVLLESRRAELGDGLINTVSFDASWDREQRSGIEGGLVAMVEEDTVGALDRMPRRRVFGWRRALRIGIGAGSAVAVLVLYSLVFPSHFRNALSRYAHPLSHVAPLTDTVLHVSPGDADLVYGADLEISATTEGRLPSRAVVQLDHGAAPPMVFDGKTFSYRVVRPEADFAYRVRAGDAISGEFTVRVRRPPEVRELAVTIRSPEYTGWPVRVEQRSTGNVSALRGSSITLDIHTTLPVESGRLLRRGDESIDLELIAPDALRATVTLDDDIEYGFALHGAAAIAPTRVFQRALKALDDRPPACEITSPGKDTEWVEGGARGLPLGLRVTDDVGLRETIVLVALAAGAESDRDRNLGRGRERTERDADGRPPGDWIEVARLDGFRGETEALPSTLLDLEAALAQLVVGRSESASSRAILYCACAVDLLGAKGYSRVFRVRRVDRNVAAKRDREALDKLRGGLDEVLRRERALWTDTRELIDEMDAGLLSTRPMALSKEQEDIRRFTVSILESWPERWTAGYSREARRAVTEAARALMPSVADQLARMARGDSLGAEPADGRSRPLELALRGERRIIAILLRALGLLDAALEARESDPEGREPDRLPKTRGAQDKLRRLVADLQDFIREQEDVIARTRELDGIEPEDFTGDEKEAIEELAAIEEKWGRFLEDKAMDLSKVAPQDMSIGTLSEEIVELVEEIDLAKNYLEGKNIELAVPTEQAGAELAAEIEMNLERWMLRDRDRLKWVMEQPHAEYDVPIADLPSELEDIIGELIDQEELMDQETEDITSSWLDSMDEGAGWDIMDGPISNMSAKGATGNLQPNDMEIGGRAGEGRSGKSQGQFVEETATGKGGRQTPTRSTPDPFESSEVEDTGKDPTGGSTGGGKLAGAGQQGLRGVPSPELGRRMGALAGKQTNLRLGAEKIDAALRRRRYYPQNLARAIELMKTMEGALNAGTPYRYETLRRRIVSELRAAEQVGAAQRDHRLEAGLEAPSRLDEELLNASGEEVPSEYRDLIRDYYRSLATGAPSAAKQDSTAQESER